MEAAKGARKEKQQCIDTRTPPSYFNPPRPPHTLGHHIYVTFFPALHQRKKKPKKDISLSLFKLKMKCCKNGIYYLEWKT